MVEAPESRTVDVADIGQFDSYRDAFESFEWDLPEHYNAGYDVVTKHATDRGKVALFLEHESGPDEQLTFWQLEKQSNRVANAFRNLDIGRGDRIALIASQRVETAIVHLAAYKLGAIVVPNSVLYGSEGLAYRLNDSGATTVVADPAAFEALEGALPQDLPVDHLIGLDGLPSTPPEIQQHEFADLRGSTSLTPVDTMADDPAVLLYTSGTTGEPKGVLHGHQIILGFLPFYQMLYELPWYDGNPVMYTPSDWAWGGGLWELLFPAWHYGYPVLGHHSSGFDAEATLGLLEQYGITHALLTPTMLNMLYDSNYGAYDLSPMVTIGTSGEPVPEELYSRVSEMFDCTLNESYGATEAPAIVTECSAWFDPVPKSMGRPVPGFTVDVIDDEGEVLPPNELGLIAVTDDAPTAFHEYWNDPERTNEALIEDWIVVGDLGYKDENGRFWFESRADDVIITSGYRVSPREVEGTLVEHEAVVDVGVIGIDDETRGQIIKAFIRLADGFEPTDSVKNELQQFVREELAKYQYPREIEFVEELPTTPSGKLKRYELTESE